MQRAVPCSLRERAQRIRRGRDRPVAIDDRDRRVASTVERIERVEQRLSLGVGVDPGVERWERAIEPEPREGGIDVEEVALERGARECVGELAP